MKALNHSKEMTALCLAQFRTEHGRKLRATVERRASPRFRPHLASRIEESHSADIAAMESEVFAAFTRAQAESI